MCTMVKISLLCFHIHSYTHKSSANSTNKIFSNKLAIQVLNNAQKFQKYLCMFTNATAQIDRQEDGQTDELRGRQIVVINTFKIWTKM